MQRESMIRERLHALAEIARERLAGVDVTALLGWLHAFGYLPDLDASDRIGSLRRVALAISKASVFHTGKDSADIASLVPALLPFVGRRRCGHCDIPRQEVKQTARQAWESAGISTIKIGFANYLTRGLTREDQRELADLSAKAWTNVCGVKADIVADGAAAHVLIHSSDATEGDGRGGMLMFTYLPQGWIVPGRPVVIPLVVDVAEQWSRSGDAPAVPYRNSLTHEFGHVLIGLEHSSPNDAVRSLMDPYLDRGVALPQPEDAKRAVEMWGPKAAPPTPAPTPAPTPSPVPSGRTVIRFDGGELSVTGPIKVDGYRLTKLEVSVAATEPERLPIPSHSLDGRPLRLSDLPPECHPPTVADMIAIDGGPT